LKYREYKQLNLSQIGKDVLDSWKKNNVFEKSISSRPENNPFTFYEGPPSANGMPGIHHVMSRTIKDIFCRYKTLQGYQVKRKGGWDTHGLPIELAVEKALGITKEDIGKKISVDDYNKECKREVMQYTDVWNDLTQKMGYWVDLENPYVTYHNEYIETLWWLLKQLYDKGFLYKGYTIQPYSPAAGTGLSSHELNQPGTYKNVKDTTVVAQFKIIEDSRSEFLFNEIRKSYKQRGVITEKNILNPTTVDTYFLAWTTTPWTLPSNTALAVGKHINYVLVRTFNQYTFKPIYIIIAKDLLSKYFKTDENWATIDTRISSHLYEYLMKWLNEGNDIIQQEINLLSSPIVSEFEEKFIKKRNIPYQVIKEFQGKDLEGIRYEQLLPYTQPADGDAFKVIIGDFVTTEDGTGIVHIAPSFGSDDFRVARQNGIGSLTLVDKRGKFTEEVTDFAGEYVKEDYLTTEEKEEERKKQGRDKYLSVDERIAIKLKTDNRAFKVEKYEHTYPHCWRTDKPVLYYPLDSWFIKTTAVKDRMVELNKTINWKPESTGTGRFGNWLENLVDWNLSRSRYWGTPLPIWRTEDGAEEICIGSIEELNHEIKKSAKAGFMPVDFELKDMHRPYVDDVILVSPSGKKMLREADLIDVWFDSGAMPYAQWHYPFENKEDFKNNFPADFIAEGVDQTRGWFFTLHAIAVMLFDSVAYKNVVSNGLVLDKNGNKMSKRLGNAADPFETIEKYGADATRWYMISNASPWDNLKFDIEGIQEVQRKFFGTLYNTYSFFALYANIDQFEIDENNIIPVEKRAELDRWIISALQKLIAEVSESYESYEPTKATRAIQYFVDEHLSNWYVRLSRRRFWKGEMTEDKKAAYETLYECLMVVSQLMSPVAPFFSDWLYTNLTEGIRDKAIKSNTPLQWESVHLSYLTKPELHLIDEELNECMQLAQDISSMTLSLRKKVGINVRQPLSRILVPLSDELLKNKIEKVKHLVLSETNIKNIEYITDTEGFIKKKVKPNFKALGAKVGKDMKDVAAEISSLSQESIQKIEREGEISVLNGSYTVLLEEVEVITEDVPGWLVNTMGRLTVALDITITEELKQEGIARELVNRIQNLRKDKNFEVTDRIQVSIIENELIKESINNNKHYICAEILADGITLVDHLPQNKERVEINEEEIYISIQKAN
jgi:isoleucyl-tRNA synthetase